MSVRTVRTDGIGCSQSVYDPKIEWDLEYISHLACVKGVLQMMSIRTVCTDGIGRFNPYTIRKLHVINGT